MTWFLLFALLACDSDEPSDAPTVETPAPVVPLKAMGEACTEDAECDGFCHQGGNPPVCGECGADADCDGGCTPPFAKGSTCNDGGLGAACETSAACADDRSCETLLDAGFASFSGCSDCATDSECPVSAPICNLDMQLEIFGGSRRCVASASAEIGATCEPDGRGDEVCGSQICAAVSLFGSGAVIGVCSHCRLDSDCAEPQVCDTAFLSAGTLSLVPGTCVDP